MKTKIYELLNDHIEYIAKTLFGLVLTGLVLYFLCAFLNGTFDYSEMNFMIKLVSVIIYIMVNWIIQGILSGSL